MIDSLERVLVGRWVFREAGPYEDDLCRRIEILISNLLVDVTRSRDGWSSLFRDAVDGRRWECTYPQIELHGGPLALLCVEPAHAHVSFG